MRTNAMSQVLRVAMVLGVGLCSAIPVGAQQTMGCGSLEAGYGPYDYRTNADKHDIVERHHFTADVENLVRGKTGEIGADIAYTLRVFPNHPRALNAMAQLSVREKTVKPKGSEYSVDCWFERGMRFKSDDATVRMVYGLHLYRVGRKADALKRMEEAASLGEDTPNFHYNLGLIYADLGRFDEALSHAHRAYSAGFNLPGLKNRLVRAGKWRDASPPVKQD